VGDIGGVGCSDDLADWMDDVFLEDLLSICIDCRESLCWVDECLAFFGVSGSSIYGCDHGPDNRELGREVSEIERKGLV